MQTSLGPVTLRLFGDTPKHRDNFLRLAKEGFYDGTLFHRVIRDFMVQGGDPNSRTARKGQMLGDGGPDYTIPAEINTAKHIHRRGALAAARQSDYVNPEKRSSSCQFYVVTGEVYPDSALTNFERRMGVSFTPEQRQAYTTVGGTPHLDGGYTVFGQVEKGMEVIDRLQRVATDGNDRPLEDVRIISMKLAER